MEGSTGQPGKSMGGLVFPEPEQYISTISPRHCCWATAALQPKRNYMAKLTGDILFTGKLHGFTAYKMRGSDAIIIRSKGGPSRKTVLTSRRYVNTRRNNSEFANYTRAARAVRHALRPLWRIADHNLQPALTAVCRKILLQDKIHAWGERQVQFSLYPHLLEGYNFSRRNSFDSVLPVPLTYTTDTQTCAARISVPALLPGVNLLLPGNFAFYRLVFAFSILPDHPDARYQPPVADIRSAWTTARTGMPAQEYNLQLATTQSLPENGSLVIGVGIEQGVNGEDAVKYAGAGKLLALVTG
jgi:hypothetical protein